MRDVDRSNRRFTLVAGGRATPATTGGRVAVVGKRKKNTIAFLLQHIFAELVWRG